MRDVAGKVAVVTGGANGIGRGIVEALLEEGTRVVIGDVEQPVLERTVAELQDRGDVVGIRTDVSDLASVEALAASVFKRYGACHLLFNNAGVTTGGGGLPWEQEPNDWRWCFSVNVFGVANGVLAFVPRMLKSGEPGVVVNTSSGDGGIAPVRTPRSTRPARQRSVVSPKRSHTSCSMRALRCAPRCSIPPADCSTPASGPRNAIGLPNLPASRSTRPDRF